MSQQQLSAEAQEELEVLKSIYGDDYSERPTAWGKGLCCVIVVRPLIHGADIHAQADLRVTLSNTYPKSKPAVELDKVKGLASSEIRELTGMLEVLAAERVGSVMIHELASAAESYLVVHNRKPQTFYEIMNSRKSRESDALRTLKDSSDMMDVSERGDSEPAAAVVAAATAALEPPFEAAEAEEADGSSGDGAAREKAWLLSFIQQAGDCDGDSSSSDDLDIEAPATMPAKAAEEPANITRPTAVLASRYQDEFVEIELLGKGGSGEVWKVRNKLDRRTYAVKKVRLDASLCVNKKIRREVTTISRLVHNGIVRYNSAWVEEARAGDEGSEGGSAEGSLFLPDTASSDLGKLAAPAPASVSSSGAGNVIKDIWSTGDDLSISFAASFDAAPGDDDDDDDDDDDEVEARWSSKRRDPSGLKLGTGGQRAGASTLSAELGSGLAHSDFGLVPAGGVERRLYIQMEFCPTTLRHIIDNSELYRRPREVCGLLRQILEALSYIHSRGVIHRDVKPANIFLDSVGDIKIGDFGLATSGRRRGGDAAADATDDTADDADDSLTTGVGTAHYRAPEQGLRNRSYDEKADLYSVGIILFEMCRPPFATGMERVVALRTLRESGVEGLLLAQGQEQGQEQGQAERENIRKIIAVLTNSNPSRRPSAAELLRSPLLPARIDTDAIYLKELTAALGRSSNVTVASQLVSSLFERSKTGPTVEPGASDSISGIISSSSSEQDGVSYDLSSINSSLQLLAPRTIGSETRYQSIESAPSSSGKGRAPIARRPAAFQQDVVTTPLHLLNALTSLCSEVFERFGAVKFTVPSLLAPRSSTISSGSSSGRGGVLECELMDRCGEVVALPSDLTTGFARYCRIVRMSSCRRYDFDRTYYSGPAAGGLEGARGHPRTRFEGVFDVVCSDALTAEREVLAAAVMLLRELSAGLPPTVIRLSDGRLLECIVSICSLSLCAPSSCEVDRETIRRVLSLCSDSSSSKAADLLKLLAEAGVDAQLHRPLLPFMQILSQQHRPAAGNKSSPLATISDLESEFYRCAPVVAVQRQLARTGSTAAVGVAFDKKDLKKLRSTLKAFSEAVETLKAAAGRMAAGAPVIVDPGLDPGRFPGSPLSGAGLYFVIEAYQVISGGERKRYKGANGVVAEGGHFEHLIGKSSSGEATATAAVALRLHMDSLLGLNLKAQGRDAKRRRPSHPAPTAAVAAGVAPGGLQQRLCHRHIDALVYCSDSSRRSAATALLRAEGLAVIEGAHQLLCTPPAQPSSAEEAEQLCHRLGVPHLLLLSSSSHPNESLSGRDVVALQTFVESAGRPAGSHPCSLAEAAAELSRAAHRPSGGAAEPLPVGGKDLSDGIYILSPNVVVPPSSTPNTPMASAASRLALIDSSGRPLGRDKKSLLQKERLLREFKIQQFIAGVRDAPLVIAVELPFLLVRQLLTLLAQIAVTGGACGPEVEAFANKHAPSRKAVRGLLAEVAAAPPQAHGESTTVLVYSLLDERMDCMAGCDAASAAKFLAYL